MADLKDYITASALTKREQRSPSYFRNLAIAGKIPGAVKVGRDWLIPLKWTPPPLPGPGQRGKRRRTEE